MGAVLTHHYIYLTWCRIAGTQKNTTVWTSLEKKMKMDTARTLPTTHHHSNHNHLHHNSNREGKKYVLNSLHCQQFFKVYKFETVNRSVHRDFKRNWRPSSGKPKYIPAYFPTDSNRKKMLFKFYAMTRNIDDGPFCLMIPNHIETNKTTKCQCLRRAAWGCCCQSGVCALGRHAGAAGGCCLNGVCALSLQTTAL